MNSGFSERTIRTKLLMWFLSIFLIAGSIYVFDHFDNEGWDVSRAIFQLCLFLVSLGVLLYTISPSKFSWGLRLVAFVMFSGYFVYFFDQLVVQKGTFSPAISRSTPSAFNALLGFLLIGVPSLFYMLWGSIWGNVDRREKVKKTDYMFFYMAISVQWFILGLSVLSVVYYFVF